MPDKSLLPVFIFSVLMLLSSRWAPRWALRRPALVGVLTAGLVLWGFLCLHRSPVELMPNVASESVTVTIGVRGGMSPQDVETLIARPLEGALGDLPRLRDLFTSAKKDRCVTSLAFEPGADMKRVTSEVHERMERVLSRLPPEIERPVIAHYEESDQPVYICAITSSRHSPQDIRRLIDERVKDPLLRVPGVANVEVGGGRERKILVEVDRDRLLAYKLSFQRVVSLLGRRNVALQVGSVDRGKNVSPIRFVGTFQSVEEMKKVIVARDPSGGTLLLENIAAVKDSFLEPESLCRLNGRSAVSLYVQKESAGNTLEIADGVQKAFDRVWADLPPGTRAVLERVVVSNQAGSIRSAMGSVRMSLVSGVLLIVLVLCLFQSDDVRPATRRVVGGLLVLLLGSMSVAAAFQWDQTLLEVPMLLGLAGLSASSFVSRDLRPPLIVGSSIPLSAVFCVILLNLCGISLNVMSLFGLALGIGMLVDNSIVVFQNIMDHHRENPGVSSAELTLRASEEMVKPLIGATVTNAVVFVPFLFLSKDIQMMYADVAAAVGASLFASLGVALAWVPLLTRALVRGNASPEKKSSLSILARGRWGSAASALDARLSGLWRWGTGLVSRVPWGRLGAPLTWSRAHASFVYAFIGFWMLWLTGWRGGSKLVFCLMVAAFVAGGFMMFTRYERVWPGLIRRRASVLGAASALTLLSCLILFLATDRDFQPSAGELDEFTVFVELSSGVRLSVSDAVVKEIERKVLDHPLAGPCVKTLVSRVEGWSSKLYVTLKPRAARDLSTQEVVAVLREALKEAGREKDDNAFVHFSSPQSGQEIVVQVVGPDYAVLEKLAQQITGGLGRVKGLEDVKMRYRPGRPEIRAEIDPERTALYGLTAEDVAESTHALMRGLRATTFRTQGQQVETIVRLRLEDRENLSTLADVPVFSRFSPQLRLTSVARLGMAKMPNEIYRQNKQRLIQVTANRAGLSLGRAAREIQAGLDRMKFPLGYYASIEGDYEEMSRSLRQMVWGLLVMVLLMYLILVLLFESLAQPLIIMASVPLCAVGAAWGLAMLRIPITTGVLVGLMMLGGIVVNNAIMLMERLNALPAGDPSERLLEAARSRMRPIFLSAASAVLGFLPMLLDTSENGALWRPLSITMIFGLLTSTVLTLYVVPCLSYVFLHDLPGFFRDRKNNRLEFTT
jgi:hydrophobic/amphiphilic exporter-1 (mainly G- bacteria), HAE1 family